MSRSKKSFTLLILVTLSVFGCKSVITTEPPINEQVVLQFGVETTIGDTEDDLTFTKVLSESRCPIGVWCAWAGYVEIELQFNSQKFRLSTLYDSTQTMTFPTYSFELISVDPYPVIDVVNPDESYSTTILIIEN